MVKTLDETAGAALSVLYIPDSCYSDGRRTRRYVRKKTQQQQQAHDMWAP